MLRKGSFKRCDGLGLGDFIIRLVLERRVVLKMR